MLVVFEDSLWRNFTPLVYTRPLFDLRCGAFTARERVAATLDAHPATALPPLEPTPEAAHSANGTNPSLPGLARPYLMACYGPQGGLGALLRESEPLTLINGRAIDLAWLPDLLNAPVGTVYETEGTLLAARLSPALASIVLYYLRDQQDAAALDELHRFGKIVEVDAPLLTYPWDLITHAGEQLVRDIPLLATRLPRYTPPDSQITVRGEHVYVAPGAQLDGPLVLDSRDGPVFIDNEAHIEPFSFIQGPAYIGTKTQISSALIRGETSIGPTCRIGGEVEASTIQGYSNKHHEGFLGHSWLGEWVNIGAMTTNSDLKNTYGNIKIAIEQRGQVDSGEIKLGCFLADHVKLGIGLHITGGAVVGTGSNLFGVHMIPKTVPPFTWGSDSYYEYRIDRMVSVAHKVMGRRKLILSPDYEALLREVFAMTRTKRGDPNDPRSLNAATGQSAETLELLARAEAEAVRAYEYVS
jgi:UDP-N-acetylglucosamine diphosphorylase/glucosamine-1-phosphate N-acetyltransferase